eukprot:CAMPEP_0170060558 /NCGR_PEP_ID=MMETSP0019_2-20121128/2458_1 /TAXON_ID=98059 /ORGANISM="Dinobryon sp., Strain UTEXLB2267" /LENGTH=95 /DNA_ID=CAMNT_0010266173 /DNA_START=394 /DNA_END=677 /DNA_ORIENTATION=+
MTYILIVNGPLKAHIKGLRASIDVRKMPKWSCPKPTLHQCIHDLMELFQNGAFVQEKFRDSVRKSFIETGCAPDINGSYSNSNKGSLPIVPTGTV